jgi:hypothetical protein
LRPHLAKNDWEQCALFEEKLFPVDFLAAIGHGHITCRQIKPFLLPNMWKNYFKFTVVRNPYKRFFSYCYFFNRENRRMQRDPLGTMKRTITNKKVTKQAFLIPQYKFVTNKVEKLTVNYVCRLENLQDDFDKVCEELKLPKTDLQKINSSNSSKHPEIYDDELKEMIYDFYRKDFELFDYPSTLS